MATANISSRRFCCFLSFILAVPFFANSQSSPKLTAYFEATNIRLNSNSTGLVDTAIVVVIPKGQSFSDGRIEITLNETKTSAATDRIRLPVKRVFNINSLDDTMRIVYQFSLPRDKKDDKTVVFDLDAYDSLNAGIALATADTTATILIKPVIADSVTTSDAWEFWLFTGTNFDPFDGAKPQEFFFRANALFKISKKIYAQIAFYKNRYFTIDSTLQIPVFFPNSPNKINDTTYSYTQGSYKRNTSQKVDPVGLQLDIFYKFGDDSTKGVSTFFGTAGFDISTKRILLENKFSNIDTATIILRRLEDRGLSTLPRNDERVSLQLPNYNFNVGFLWILNTSDINIKAHLTAGISSFQGAKIYTPRGATQPIAKYDSVSAKPYIQLRMFATAKNSGLSFGFEAFARKQQFPQFNFTLSKVFDLKNFLNILTPVSALDPKKNN